MDITTRKIVTVVAALGWLLNLVAGMIPSLSYESNLEANAPLMLILGSLYGTKNGKKSTDDDE